MSVPLLSQAQVNEPESAEPYVPPESAVPSASEPRRHAWCLQWHAKTQCCFCGSSRCLCFQRAGVFFLLLEHQGRPSTLS